MQQKRIAPAAETLLRVMLRGAPLVLASRVGIRCRAFTCGTAGEKGSYILFVFIHRKSKIYMADPFYFSFYEVGEGRASFVGLSLFGIWGLIALSPWGFEELGVNFGQCGIDFVADFVRS